MTGTVCKLEYTKNNSPLCLGLGSYICSISKSGLLSHLYFMPRSLTAYSITCCVKHQTAFFFFGSVYWRLRRRSSGPGSEPVVPLTSSFIPLLSPAQFDGADRPAKDETARATLPRQPQRPPAQQQQQQQHHLRQKSWTQKMLRSSPTSGTDAEACCVDPTLPLEKQRSGNPDVLKS